MKVLEGIEVRGFPVTSRMKRWGITGMVIVDNSSPVFAVGGDCHVPLCVARWLAEEDGPSND